MNLTCLKSGIWQAELRVPEEVRAVIGKTRFAKSTGTRNKREAVLRAAPLLERWQSDIELAKSDPQALLATKALREARQSFWTGSIAADATLKKMAWLDELPPTKASLYTGIDWSRGVPLPAYMNQFVESHYLKPRTRLEARRYILELAMFTPTLDAITRLNAQRWLSHEENKGSSARRALKTMQKAAGYLSEYFAWLQYKNLVNQTVANPFRELHYPKTLPRSRQYEALSYPEICSIRTAAAGKGDELLVTYIDVARFTGLRLAEIGALTTESIELVNDVACFRVKSDAKTAASSSRLVPISSRLREFVDLDCLDMKNAENAVGKRFGRLKRQVLQDGASRSKCFHSIRKFVVTTLEQAGIAEGIAADLVGHEKPNITYNVYSNGSSMSQLQQAIKALDDAQSLGETTL